MMYYNYGLALGVVGCEVGHTDGEFTFIPGAVRFPWVRTCDLYASREEAEKAPLAKFFFAGSLVDSRSLGKLATGI